MIISAFTYMNNYFTQFKANFLNFYTGNTKDSVFIAYVNTVYYDILRGGFINTEKLIIYPLIVMTLKLFDTENSKEAITAAKDHIYAVLNGSSEFYHNIELSLPAEMYALYKNDPLFDPMRRELFESFYHILLKCGSNTEKQKCIDKYLPVFEKLKRQDGTVFGIIEDRIGLTMRAVCANGCSFKGALKLFPADDSDSIIYDVLTRYLEYYIGIKSFQAIVHITSQKQAVHLPL